MEHIFHLLFLYPLSKIVVCFFAQKKHVIFLLRAVFCRTYPLNFLEKMEPLFIKMLSSYLYRGASGYDDAAVCRRVTHAGGRLPTYKDRCGAFDNRVRRTGADAYIAHDCRRQFTDQYVGYSGTCDRAAHMRYRRWKCRSLHGTGVHVCKSCCRWHIVLLLSFLVDHYHRTFNGGLAAGRNFCRGVAFDGSAYFSLHFDIHAFETGILLGCAAEFHRGIH